MASLSDVESARRSLMSFESRVALNMLRTANGGGGGARSAESRA